MVRNISSAIDKEGVHRHIDSVKNGKRCDCFCPVCKEPLLAKNNGKINKHHFAHFGNTDCSYNPESALHLLAKQVILDCKTICFPVITVGDVMLFDKSSVTFNEVLVEKKIGKFTPDLICKKDGKVVWVEIVVTHPCEGIKVSHCKERGIPLLEIYLDSLDRSATYSQLKSFITEISDCRKFLNNPRVQPKIHQEIERQIKNNAKAQNKKDVWYLVNRITNLFHLEKWLVKRKDKEFFGEKVPIFNTTLAVVASTRFMLKEKFAPFFDLEHPVCGNDGTCASRYDWCPNRQDCHERDYPENYEHECPENYYYYEDKVDPESYNID